MSDTRPRLEKILDLYGQALAEAVGQREPISQEVKLSNKDLVLRFAGADPTDGKSRTQWLIKTYIEDKHLKLEDLGRVDAALAAFERFKRKLPLEQRELSRLKSLRVLETLVDPFIKAEERARSTRDLSTATGREKRRLEEWKARDESIIIQEGEGLPTIAVPMTEFASKWWGRGTKWCTAAEKNNAFASYHKDAPLVIIVCPDGAKFQMCVKNNNIQFMDNTDKDVSKGIILKRWDEFQSLVYWAIEQNGNALASVPTKYQTPTLCRMAVVQNGEALEYVHRKYRTPELCRIAVQQSGRALQYIPENLRTPELCRISVEQDGNALSHVPILHRTFDICSIAVEQNGSALQYVPDKHKTPELYLLAVKQDGLALYKVPHDLKSSHTFASKSPSCKDLKIPTLYRLAIEQDGRVLNAVPEEYHTTELYCLAVQQNGLTLAHVPKNKRTPELCRLAIQQSGQALFSVPEEHMTSELCRLAVEQDGQALNYVPKNLRNLELCRLAVEQDGWALKYVRLDLISPISLEVRASKSPICEDYYKLCCIAVQQNRSALQLVPENYQTPELLALIPPVKPQWHPDILQGLYSQSQSSHESTYPVLL
jgi:Domain of unknown function (DUF4116)